LVIIIINHKLKTMYNQTLQESKEALILLRSFPDGEISVENRALLDEKLSANTHRLKTADKDHGLTGIPTTDLQGSDLGDVSKLDTNADQQIENTGLVEQAEQDKLIEQTEAIADKEQVKVEAKEEVKEHVQEEGKPGKKAGKEKPSK